MPIFNFIFYENCKTVSPTYLILDSWYVINVKDEFTFVQGEVYTSLDDDARAWLH